MEIGKRIQLRRKAMGLTTDQLAEMVGCSKERIRQFEKGEIPVKNNAGTFSRVKRVLKVRNRRARPARKPEAKRGRPAVPAKDRVLRTLLSMATELRQVKQEIAALRRDTMVVTVKEPSAIIAEKTAETAPTGEPATTAAPESLAA